MFTQDQKIFCQSILSALKQSQNPQSARSASQKILQMRKTESYRPALWFILMLGGTLQLSQEILLAVIVQLKNHLFIKPLSAQQLLFVKNSLFGILNAHLSPKNHKTFRKIIDILTQQNSFQWVSVQNLVLFVSNQPSPLKLAYKISTLIGIPQAHKLTLCQEKKPAQNLQLLQQILQIIIQILRNCYSNFSLHVTTVHYIIKFYNKFLDASSYEKCHEYIKYLPLLIEWGKQIYKNLPTSISQQNLQVSNNNADNLLQQSKCKKWFMKMLTNWLNKQNQLDNRTGKKYKFQPWFEPNVTQIFMLLFSKLDQNQFQRQPCGDRIRVILPTLLNCYVRVLNPIQILLGSVQVLLYETIPKLLYNLVDVVDCFAVPVSYKNNDCNYRLKYKKCLLSLWKTLIGLDIVKCQKMYMKKNGRKQEQQNNGLPTISLHLKFIFQKLTFYSMFSMTFKTVSDNKSIKAWNMLEPNWIIVAFDLFRSISIYLMNPDSDYFSRSVQNSKMNIHQIVPTMLNLYILPKILQKPAIVQAHAISVLVTYRQYFRDMKLVPQILQQMQSIITNKNQNEQSILIYQVLNLLQDNPQIRQIVKNNLEAILEEYLRLLEDNQDNDISINFTTIFRQFYDFIKMPERIFQTAVKKIVDCVNNKMLVNNNCYNQVIEHFITKELHKMNIIQLSKRQEMVLGTIKKGVYKLFQLSIFKNDQTIVDEIFKDDVLKIIGIYILKTKVIGIHQMVMYFAYCLSLSHFDPKTVKIISECPMEMHHQLNKIKQKIMPCDRDLMDQMLAILQIFSLKPQLHQYLYNNKKSSKQIRQARKNPSSSNRKGLLPINAYFSVIEKLLKQCKKKFIKNSEIQSQNQNYRYNQFYIQSLIVDGFSFMIQNAYNMDNAVDETLGQIWNIAVFQIYRDYKKMNENLNTINMVSSEYEEYTAQYLDYKIVQLLSTYLHFQPDRALLSFQQTPGLVGQFISLGKQFVIGSRVNFQAIKHQIFRKRLLFGLQRMLQITEIKPESIIDLLHIVNKIAMYMLKREKNIKNQQQKDEDLLQISGISEKITQQQYSTIDNISFDEESLFGLMAEECNQIWDIEDENDAILSIIQSTSVYMQQFNSVLKEKKAKQGQLNSQSLKQYYSQMKRLKKQLDDYAEWVNENQYGDQDDFYFAQPDDFKKVYNNIVQQ